jgi:citrate lyase beta subunit
MPPRTCLFAPVDRPERFHKAPGAAELDGRMIDRPVVLQARRTLQHAGT